MEKTCFMSFRQHINFYLINGSYMNLMNIYLLLYYDILLKNNFKNTLNFKTRFNTVLNTNKILICMLYNINTYIINEFNFTVT